MDLHDKIVELVRTCLDPEVRFPAADEDLMPLLDGGELEGETFAEGLAEIADAAGIDPQAMFPPDSRVASARQVAHLQMLAPFWQRASSTLECLEERAERVTINGLVASAQAGRWQSVGGTSIRYVPMDRQSAIRRVSVALVVPGAFAVAIGGLDFWSCEGRCNPCSQTYGEALIGILPVSYSIAFVLAAVVGVCAVWTVLRVSTGRLSDEPI